MKRLGDGYWHPAVVIRTYLRRPTGQKIELVGKVAPMRPCFKERAVVVEIELAGLAFVVQSPGVISLNSWA